MVQVMGVIEALNKSAGPFSADDVQLLEAMAAHAARAIETDDRNRCSILGVCPCHVTALFRGNSSTSVAGRPSVALVLRLGFDVATLAAVFGLVEDLVHVLR